MMAMGRRKGVISTASVLTLFGACSTASTPEGNPVVTEPNPSTTEDAGEREPGPRDAGKRPPVDAPDAEVSTVDACGQLRAIVRDFTPTHPDFESKAFEPKSPSQARQAVEGLVESVLGADLKPVFRSTGETRPAITSQATFDQWYRDVPNANMRLDGNLPLRDQGDGTWVYDNSAYFPIDGLGFGNYRKFANGLHNFHFTTEIHLTFDYKPGQKFTFRGDDDLWLFINQQLALDLGGPHLPLEGTVDMDALAEQLGIAAGDEVSMHIFQAERHTEQSNFHIETNIDCLVVLI